MEYEYSNVSLMNYLKCVSSLTVSLIAKDLDLPKGTNSSFSRGNLSSDLLIKIYDEFQRRLKQYHNDLENSGVKIAIITVVDNMTCYNDGFSVFGQRKRIEDYLKKHGYSEYHKNDNYRYIDLIKKLESCDLEQRLEKQDIAILFSRKLLSNSDLRMIEEICKKLNIELCFVN